MAFPSAADLAGHDFSNIDGTGYLHHQWMGDVGDVLDALGATYQPLDSDLTAIAALSTTSYGRAFLEFANAAAGIAALGLGTAATSNTGDFDAAGAAAAAQSASQPVDSDLTAIAALTTTSFGRGLLTSANAAALATSAGLGNVDNTSNATERAATATLTNKTLTSPVVNSPTGIVKADVGLGNVDNTSNATERAASATLTNKTLTAPVLNGALTGTGIDTDATFAANSDTVVPSQKAVKTAEALKAPLASPALTGTPTAPTASPATNTTQVATTAYADAIAALKQPLDSDLTTIAGLTATTDNMIQSVGSAWASRTPAQVKSALAIAESDVTNLTTDLGALQTQTAVQAAQIAAQQRAALGYYVGQGCAYTPNATPTKLDATAGTTLQGTVEVVTAAQTAISTTIASLADATNPKWVAVEIDASAVTQFNQGTAAASPALPTFTASRVPVYLIYVPANATNVDALLTTNNGLAKLIDIRQVVPGVSPAGWLYDQNTWVYASATTFTIAGIDATGYLKPGTKISYNDGGVDYGVIASVAFSTNTTVTLITTSDYSIANATLFRPRYSYAAVPQGFPTWFNWAPTLAGYSANPTNGVYRWTTQGTAITLAVRQATAGTSNNTVHTLTLPVTAKTVTNMYWQAFVQMLDNGAVAASYMYVQSAGTVLQSGLLATGVATASGGSYVIGGVITYEF